MLRKLSKLISFQAPHHHAATSRAQSFFHFDSQSMTHQRFLSTQANPSPGKRGRPKKNETEGTGSSGQKDTGEKKSRGRPKSTGEGEKKPKKEIDPETANKIIKKQKSSIAQTEDQLPIVLSRGRGSFVTDVFNARYYDFDALSLNHGHQNPLILKALRQQLNKLTLTSRAFYNDQLGQTAEYIGKQFKYAQVLLMNSGLEGTESAIKIARKWAYEVKGVPDGQARILFAKGNSHGNSIAMLAASNQLKAAHNFGPYGGLNFDRIDYNNLEDLELTLQREPNYAAFVLEPIQTDNGVIIPDAGYLKEAKRICQKYNVLLVADELYTGLGRTGKLLASEWEKVKPDIAIVGESLGGGIYPISAIMGPKKVMKVLTPGTHGSTFGGNPLGCVIARTSLQILQNQGFLSDVRKLSKTFGDVLGDIKSPLIRAVRQKGLVAGIEIESEFGISKQEIAQALAKRGVLAKVTDSNTIRLAPPLVISEGELINGLKYVRLGIKDCEKSMDKDKAKIKMAVQRAQNPQPKPKTPKKRSKPAEKSELMTAAADQQLREISQPDEQKPDQIISEEESDKIERSQSESAQDSSQASESEEDSSEMRSEEGSSEESRSEKDSAEESSSERRSPEASSDSSETESSYGSTSENQSWSSSEVSDSTYSYQTESSSESSGSSSDEVKETKDEGKFCIRVEPAGNADEIMKEAVKEEVIEGEGQRESEGEKEEEEEEEKQEEKEEEKED